MGKTKCIKVYLNNTFDYKNFGFKESEIKDGKNKVKFTPLCVLKENKPRRIFWRSARHLILFVEGAMSALHFTKATEEMQTHWGKDESRLFVKKMVALASVQVQPLKTWQFWAIMLLLGISIVVGVLNLQKFAGLGL